MTTTTPKQIAALRCLHRALERDYGARYIRILGQHYGEVYPAALGHAVTGGLKRNGYGMSAQGLGRIGGAMGQRLVKKGWAWSTSRGYAINSDGITELSRHESLNPMG